MKAQIAFFWAYDVKYRVSKWRERAMTWIAWHLPHELVMWCAVRVGAHATMDRYGDQVVPELLFMDALKRWNDA